MAFTSASLADGQIAAADAAIYTVPALTKAYIKTVTIFSTHAATQTVILRIKRSGGTARKWKIFALDQNESGEAIESGSSLQLSAGDEIRAETTNATSVDFLITGVLEA